MKTVLFWTSESRKVVQGWKGKVQWGSLDTRLKGTAWKCGGCDTGRTVDQEVSQMRKFSPCLLSVHTDVLGTPTTHFHFCCQNTITSWFTQWCWWPCADEQWGRLYEKVSTASLPSALLSHSPPYSIVLSLKGITFFFPQTPIHFFLVLFPVDVIKN